MSCVDPLTLFRFFQVKNGFATKKRGVCGALTSLCASCSPLFSRKMGNFFFFHLPNVGFASTTKSRLEIFHHHCTPFLQTTSPQLACDPMCKKPPHPFPPTSQTQTKSQFHLARLPPLSEETTRTANSMSQAGGGSGSASRKAFRLGRRGGNGRWGMGGGGGARACDRELRQSVLGEQLLQELYTHREWLMMGDRSIQSKSL